MSYTHEVDIDLGILGAVPVDIVTEVVPGERGCREGGRQMEPDIADAWKVTNIAHPVLSNDDQHNRYFLMRTYQHDAAFREYIDDRLASIRYDIEDSPLSAAV